MLSCFALVGRPEPVTVLHVCTGGPTPPVTGDWDMKSGFADSDAAVTHRRSEEQSAFTGTPHQFRDLELLDAQYVGGEQSDASRRRMTQAVAEWIAEVGTPSTVIVPVGAGCEMGQLVPLARLRAFITRGDVFWSHPDHLAVRDACLAATLDHPGVEVLLYEEMPYRLTKRGDAVTTDIACRFGPSARVERIDVHRRPRTRRVGGSACTRPSCH